MAEHLSQENGDTAISLAPPASKSPSKSRKIGLGSFFKRSGTDESGVRGSSKERGSSRSRKKKSDTLEANHDTSTHLTGSMETGRNDEQRAAGGIKEISHAQYKEFEEDHEPEQKSVGDLSSKKIQKRNKELSKQNNQLAKSVDALKKEREELLSDKQKLKSENKTLERELKKVSSKGEVRLSKKSSQMSVEAFDLDTTEEMASKIQALEAQLAERDRKLKRVRDRLQRISSEMPDIGTPLESLDSSRRESETVPSDLSLNGGVLDSSMVERLLDDKNKMSKLQVENTELRARVSSLEGSLAQMQAQLAGGETKTRKRSGNFFRRGKAQSKSMVMKSSEDVAKERELTRERESRRSRSPDFISVSDSFQDELADINTLSYTDPKTVGSVPNFIYSGLSPRTVAKRAHGDIQTLQTCLKLAIEEKKSASEQVRQLELELIAARDATKQQESLVQEKEKALKKVKTSKSTLSSENEELAKQVRVLKGSNDNLRVQSADKEGEISKLKDEIKDLQVRLAESEKMHKESEDVFVPASTISAQQTPKKEVKVAKTVASTAKPPLAPESQNKPSSKDGETEKTRKTSQPKMRCKSSSSSIDKHYDSVANTRAMFEQKIVSMRDENQSPKRSGRKTSWSTDRRGSCSGPSPGLKPTIMHAKSSSFDASSIVLQEPVKSKEESKPPRRATVTTPEPKISPKHTPAVTKTEQKTSMRNTTTSTPQSKPTSLNINKSVSGAAKVQSFTSTNKETTPVSKVSKIIVKSIASPTNSPVFGRKELKANGNPVLQKQMTAPAMHVIRTSSPTTPSSSPIPRAMSIDSKKDISIKVPTITTSSVKRTVTAPVKSNSVVISTTTSSTPSNQAKVTVSTSTTSNSPEPVVLRQSNRPQIQRPQSMLAVPSSMKKASSLQDIPEQTSSVEAPTPVAKQAVVVQRSPVPRRFQRRERSDRPKTMYAGRAETTNLVNLISRFQQQEAAKDVEKQSPVTPQGKTESRVLNGKLSPVSNPNTSLRVATQNSTSSSSGVILRTSPNRVTRPNSYYGAPAEKVVEVKAPSSPVSYKKPPPSERPLLRAQTVGTGLGINRQSKKAMLLRWCQRETMAYENVRIQNFDTSFSDGLAFCALIHHFVPDKIPYNSLSCKSRERNFTLAFQVAEEAGIPSLLDVEDMVNLPIPDWMSVMTYVSFIYNKFGQPNNSS